MDIRYFINDRDQIRKISDPKQEFLFKINKNDRWNEMQREAMNGNHFPSSLYLFSIGSCHGNQPVLTADYSL